MDKIIIKWPTGLVELSWVGENNSIALHFVTSVHGFCFKDEKVLMVENVNRGFDIPGEQIEVCENPIDSLRREIQEEACAIGDEYQKLGYLKIDHSLNPQRDKISIYPEVGYQLYYYVLLGEILPFTRRFETSDRFFVTKEELPKKIYNLNQMLQVAYNTAIEKQKNRNRG